MHGRNASELGEKLAKTSSMLDIRFSIFNLKCLIFIKFDTISVKFKHTRT